MAPNLKGMVCIVTGATKGIGRGIALQLGSAGGKVYVTGRTQSLLDKVAEEITSRGGIGVPVQVDHGNDKAVEKFFEQVAKDENGKLDILVNNAFSAVHTISTSIGKPFWTLNPSEQWDSINGVGLRNHYLCTAFGARIMVPNKSGLIVNISSYGGWSYVFNVPYTIGKSGCDRMATDCAAELQKENVTMISLWPGPVKTEHIQATRKSDDPIFGNAESVEFAGMGVAHFAADPAKHSKTGRILTSTMLAEEYGLVDIDGTVIKSDHTGMGPNWFDKAFGKA